MIKLRELSHGGGGGSEKGLKSVTYYLNGPLHLNFGLAFKQSIKPGHFYWQNDLTLTLISHMFFSQNHVSCFFTNHDTRSISISSCQSWHDWGICNSKSFHTINTELVIHNCIGVIWRTHSTCSNIMVIWICEMSYNAFPVGISKWFVGLGTERIGLIEKFGSQPFKRRQMTDFETDFNSFYKCGHVKGIIKEVWSNDWMMVRICGAQQNLSSASRMMQNWIKWKSLFSSQWLKMLEVRILKIKRRFVYSAPISHQSHSNQIQLEIGPPKMLTKIFY